jgi:signal transduction histidine kinase
MKAGEDVGHRDDIFVQADKDRIMQVISNLLYNALKFTSDGVISIAVVKRKGEEEMAVVSIQPSDQPLNWVLLN